ncbi:MAG: sensor histidine kinase [Deltaproteobacteria bacterium]|nr:sensor histidine kinase [Deltaproteobacteria bacterium]
MEKSRIKLDFLVHDLKVPLAVIEAGIQALLQRRDKYGPLTEKQVKVLERALRNTIITKTLVNDALELGRSSEGVIYKTPFKLASIVQDTFLEIFDLRDQETAERIRECNSLQALKQVLSERGVFLAVEEQLWNESFLQDERKVKQILRNLLSNALKYRKKRVDIKIERGEKELNIFIKDDGEGIPSRYHKKIFECYFQMDMEENHCVRGHGVGLAGVLVLLEDMGGEMSLQSDEGKGATFC